MKAQKVSISVVSHGQLALARPMLEQLKVLSPTQYEVLLTLNLGEDEEVLTDLQWPGLRVIRNLRPKGFGANHNRAFEVACGDIFMVLNPDLRLPGFDWSELLLQIKAQPNAGCWGPRIVDIGRQPTDSPRRFPTLPRMAQRLLLGRRGPEYPELTKPTPVDWVGGMFMVFRREVFRRLGGFDERFFMYMEDVDICRRLHTQSQPVVFVPGAEAVHDAQRQNRRSARHMAWHLKSLIRYLLLYRVTARWDR